MSTLTRTPAPRAVVPRSSLAGAGTLMRLILRRDRIRILLWTLGIVGGIAGSAASFADVFPTMAERGPRAELMASPMMRALNGPGYGLDDYTLGAMVANELLVLGALAAAVMSLLMVVRHTRAEEEAGRTELLRATVSGAFAAPAAALTVAVGVNLVIGALTAVALVGAVDALDAVGAWAFGLALAMVGVVFAAVAVVAAQVSEHARAATGLAATTLGVAFALRAIGDMGGVDDRALSWASPLGWAHSARAFVDERWWPLLLGVALAGAIVAAAFALATRRDDAAGLVRPRPGAARASRLLVRPTGLALRLQRGSIVAWSVGLALLGAAFGGVIGEIEAFLAENPRLEDILAGADGGLVDAFLATVVRIIALLATGYALSAALRLRSEETEGRAEPLLATPLPRTRWVAGHLWVALGGSTAVLLAGAAGLGAAAALDQGEGALLGELLLAGLVYLPALWLVIGVVVALVGLAPRAAGAAWVVLAHALVVGLLGDVLDLPEAVRALSPLHHVPALPGADVTAAPLLALGGLAAALVAAGLAAFRRRDVSVT
jgi:ABC-2 type transport system permease protein